jgi:hypothetical protein
VRSILLNVRLPLGCEADLISCGRQWRIFENLLRDSIRELGHELLEWDGIGAEPDADFKIHAHRCWRDGGGDLFYKQMHICEAFTLDREGWGADDSRLQQPPCLAQVDPAAARRFCQDWAQQALTTGVSKHLQPPPGCPPELPERYILVPLQRPHDYVQIHHSPVSLAEFVESVAEWANASRQNVVIKPHTGSMRDPDLLEHVQRCCAKYRFIHLLNGNVHDLIAGSIGVISVNSGVGFESLLHGKPVATVGNCDYKWATFRTQLGGWDEAADYFRVFSAGQQMDAYRFVYYYCFVHAYFVSEQTVAICRERLLRELDQALSRTQGRTHSSPLCI